MLIYLTLAWMSLLRELTNHERTVVLHLHQELYRDEVTFGLNIAPLTNTNFFLTLKAKNIDLVQAAWFSGHIKGCEERMIPGFFAIGRKYGLLADSSTMEEFKVFWVDDSVHGRVVVLGSEAIVGVSSSNTILRKPEYGGFAEKRRRTFWKTEFLIHKWSNWKIQSNSLFILQD